MSVTIDTNVLLYASNSQAAEHSACAGLISQLTTGPRLVTIFWPVLVSYLRIATHPAIFANPLEPVEAEAALDALLGAPAVRVVGEDAQFWSAYRKLDMVVRPRGNVVPDAAIVAMMTAHGVRTIYTRNKYFRQFDGIEVIDPLTA